MTKPHQIPDWADNWLSWSTYEIAKDRAEQLVEEGEYDNFDAAFTDACGDSDLYDWEYEDVCECLTDFMKEVSDGNRYWRCYVNNFGWRHQDGYKDFKAENGRELLREVLPNTECTYYIYLSKDKAQIVINNAHHDAPMGGEMYYIGVEPEEEEEDD